MGKYDMIPDSVWELADNEFWEYSDAYPKDANRDSNAYKMLLLNAAMQEKMKLLEQNTRDWRNFENARGSVLDMYGQWLGLPRGELTDPQYILRLKTLRRSEIEAGTFNCIYESMAYLFGVGPLEIWIDEVFPAKIAIAVTVAPGTSLPTKKMLSEAKPLIKKAVAAGVGFDVQYRSNISTYAANLYACSNATVHIHLD